MKIHDKLKNKRSGTITKKNDIFIAYAIFNEDSFKQAYEYAINQKS